MNPALDHANFCLDCGRGCGMTRKFCNQECFERWMADRETGLQLNPGYSILPERSSTQWEPQ